MPRVSPRSDHIAFLIASPLGSGVEIQRLDGGRVAGNDMPQVFGHAWSPDGREVWFTGSETGSAHDRALYALSLDGSRRLVARIPGGMSVYDVAPDGRSALVSTGGGWFGINAGTAGGSREQSLDLYWADPTSLGSRPTGSGCCSMRRGRWGPARICDRRMARRRSS